jgi:signal transduction histidine kinase
LGEVASMNIRSKLFVTIFSFIIMTLLATSFATINIFSSVVVSQVKENLEANAKSLSSEILTSFDQKVSDITTLSSSIGKFHFLNHSQQQQQTSFNGERELALSFLMDIASKDKASLYIYNRSGTIVMYSNYNHVGSSSSGGISISSNRNLINQQILNVPYHGNIYQDEVVPVNYDYLNNSAIRIAAPIYNYKSATVDGAVLLTFPLSTMFNNVDTNLYKYTIFYLLSNNGTILYSNSNTKNTNANYNDDDNNNNNLKGSAFANQPIFQDIKRSSTGIATGIYPSIVKGNEDTIFVATKVDGGTRTPLNGYNTSNSNNNNELSSNSWLLITSTDANKAFKDVLMLRNLFIYITAITLSICVIAVLLMAKRISRPLTKLKDAAVEIGNGNLGLVIHPLQTNDEIDELAFQLETMRKNVKTRTEEIMQKDNELQNMNRLLLQTERSKDEFVTIISHELKNPITPMKIYTQMLLRADMGELNEEQKRAIQVIRRNTDKLQRLASDILDVYKLEIGKANFSKSDANVTDLVQQAIDEMMPSALDKQVNLISEIRVGPSTNTVYCDAVRISQVLSNLIKNSIDFVAPKEGKITIMVEEYHHEHTDNYSKYDTQTRNSSSNDRRVEPMILFTVQDNGIGIPPDKAESLFRKFYQLDTGTIKRHSGTGLGLAICKGIIEAHGGMIWIDKSYTKGASIMFTLPIKKMD